MSQSQAVANAHLIDVANLEVEQAVERLIGHAVSMGASDMFLMSNGDYVSVQVRHLGIIRPMAIVGQEIGRRYMQHIKANADMDVAPARRPVDGRWIYESDDLSVDLRINIIPTLYGEDFGIRLLVRDSQLFRLDNLGMMKQQVQTYRSMLDSPGGLILITGPSGAGKTATLYASLDYLNDGTKKINTIEDPVEFDVEGLRQSQINHMIDLGFAELLRSVLRQSPDVIMVGEIRDAQTAQTAVRAANSGHMVFSTLHAPIAAGAVQSMLSLDVNPHFLAQSLRGIISQRLVRTLCTDCRLEFDITHAPHIFDDIKPWLGKDEGRVFYAPKGCAKCQDLGYAGRTGVFEMITIDRQTREMISQGASVGTIREAARKNGMIDIRDAAMLKVARGETSTEEVFRVIPSEHLLGEN